MARQRASSPKKTPAPSSPAPPTRCKFILYDLRGKPRAHYLVERHEVERPKKPGKTVAHSILLIDRSGSMADHIEDLKGTLRKLLTLDEYGHYNLLVTLISYAAQGDCRVHFQRSAIQKVMEPGSRQLAQLEKMHVGGRTCLSQALQLALSLARDRELTAITVHSDGYPNDPSAASEAKAIDRLCRQMQKRPIFVNTIAYTSHADFPLLARVANRVCGSCVRAGSLREVYDALCHTEKLLGSDLAPPIRLPLPKDCVYQVFLSRSGDKVVGAAGALNVCGLRDEDDAVLYRFKELDAAAYKKLKDVPEAQTSEPVLALARTCLAEGNLTTARYALASSFDATLIERHGHALTGHQVADLADDLNAALFQPDTLEGHEVLDHVPVNERISVLALVRMLAEHKGAFTVNRKRLERDYVRRGVRHVLGWRDEEGRLIEPEYRAEPIDKGPYARVTSFYLNHNTANLNLTLARPARLVPAAGGAPVTEVAGITLDRLTSFRSYTLVANGELNVKALHLRISQKKLFNRLQSEGVLEQAGEPADAFDPEAEYTLRLDALPLVPPFEGKVDLEGVFEDLAGVRVLASIVVAHLVEGSGRYTPEQVEELRRHYLSENLYFNFPTTTEYADLEQALAEGKVDYRVSNRIDLGNTHILNLGKLMSANKFLQRTYEVIDADGSRIPRPTFAAILESGVSFRHKPRSPRTRTTAVDDFMRRIFDDFLGLENNGAAVEILERVGARSLAKVVQRRAEEGVSRKEYVAALADARRKLDTYAERVFEKKVSPLVFYVGATGVLPEGMNARAMTAAQLKEAYPELRLSKEEREGKFFLLGEDTILGVHARNELYSR
jgi:Mg-chelatase subunit ChlD